jgi:ketosteroid isomerase-like protein
MTAPSPQQGPDHFTPPPAEPVSKSSSRRNLIIAGVLAGGGCLLVVIVVIGLIIAFALRGGGSGTDGEESTAAELSPEEQATALVTDYFDALEAGDAETALELNPIDEDAGPKALPVEVYTAALEAAPLTAVEIGTPVIDTDGLAEGEVPVTFTVGEETVSDVYRVHDYDDDGVLELVGSQLRTEVPDGLDGLGLTVNGTEVSAGEPLALLPGGYEIAFGAEHFAPSSTDPLLVGESAGSFDWPEATLTEDGLKAFRGAVDEAVQACLKKTTLEAGCGMTPVPEKSSDGWTMTEDTVKRSISEDTQRTIDTMEATPSYDEPTYVEGTSVGSVETTIECTKDGQKGRCELWLGGGMGTPNVDMADPELPVTWS